MKRRFLTLLMIPILACVAFSNTLAQDDEKPESEQVARTIELRIPGASRGYARPLSNTGQRIAGLEGVDSAVALGFAGDTMRFEVRTTLTGEELAAVMQGELVSESARFTSIAPKISLRARRAEARHAITQIALKILALPKPGWNSPGADPHFVGLNTTTQKLEFLGLGPEILHGHFYKPADYNINEDWSGDSGVYRVYVGDEWQEVYVPGENWWDSPEETDAKTPTIDSPYVGARVYLSAWTSTFTWADPEGLQMAGVPGRRSDTNSDGELRIKRGADWMLEIMQAVGAHRVRNPRADVGSLPKGRGWGLLAELGHGQDLDRWDEESFSSAAFELTWETRDKRLIAILKAHHEAHPMYLELELDTRSVVEDYDQRANDDKGASFDDLARADVDAALTWIVEAESGVEVFKQRRDEARKIMDAVSEGVRAALGENSLEVLCGRLDDAELRQRLGIKVPEDGLFKGRDFVVTKQMFGDIEIAVGNVRTGGRYWTLVNAESGAVIRSAK